MTKWMNKTISELHEALVKKEVTPLELVEEAISLVEKDDCNAALTAAGRVAADRLRRQIGSDV